MAPTNPRIRTRTAHWPPAFVDLGLWRMRPASYALALASALVLVGYLTTTRLWLAAVLAAGMLVAGLALHVGLATAVPAGLAVAWAGTVFMAEAGLGGDAGEAGSLGLQKILPLAAVGALALPLWRRGTFAKLPVVATLALAYFAWLTLASFFSPNQWLSLGRVLQGLGPLVVALIVRRSMGGTTALLWATVAALMAHITWAIINPSYAGVTTDLVRLRGLLIANAFGFAAGIVVVVGLLIWQLRLAGKASGLIAIAMAVLGARAIQLGVARTAFIAVPVAILVAVTARRRTGTARRRSLLLLATLLTIGFVASFEASSLSNWFARGTNVVTLTGRTDVWDHFVAATARQPIMGIGPGTPRFDPTIQPDIVRPGFIGQAHSSLVEALVSGGFPAAALWLAMVVALAHMLSRLDPPYRTLGLAIWGALMVYAITMGQMAGFGMGWFLFVSLLALPAAAGARPTSDSRAEVSH